MIICVVGESFVNAKMFDGGRCDYAIYPDQVRSNRTIIPMYGLTSWKAFTQAVAAHPQMKVGVSFPLLQGQRTNGTVDHIRRSSRELRSLVQAMNLSAMGLLNFRRHEGIRTNFFQTLFQVLDTALRQQTGSQPMVFLGVELYTTAAVNNFVSEVVSVRFLTTIIIQTHAHATLGQGCLAFPVSSKNASWPVPSFGLAELAEKRLRSQGDKFRIMFSSTMGVATFVGANQSSTPTAPFQQCDHAVMADYDTLCNSSGFYLHTPQLSPEEFAYAAWLESGIYYWASYEVEATLSPKLDRYAKKVSEGWAIFEFQRDVWTACNSNSYRRLELIKNKTRPASP